MGGLGSQDRGEVAAALLADSSSSTKSRLSSDACLSGVSACPRALLPT